MSFSSILILLTGAVLGLVTGFLMHRNDYCVAGMFRDLFIFGLTPRFRSLLLLLAVSIPVFELVRASRLLNQFPFPFMGPPAMTNLLGGLLFGIGMVLAGGCVVGTLYKLGGGSFLSLVAFVGLIIGCMIYSIIHPAWITVVNLTRFPTAAVTLPQLLSLPPWSLLLPLWLLLAALIYRWFVGRKMEDTAVVDGYIQPWKVALGLSLVGGVSLVVAGMPLGITTSYSKFGALLMQVVTPGFTDSIVYYKLQPLHYTPPVGGVLLTGGTGPALDAVALIQYPLIGGIVAGSAISAILLGEWKIRFNPPWRQLLSAFLGGIIMGMASRMAPACNIWHLFGGLPILALQSILFLLGLLPGAWIGGLLLRRLADL